MKNATLFLMLSMLGLLTACRAPQPNITPEPVEPQTPAAESAAVVEQVQVEVVEISPTRVELTVQGYLPDAGCTSIASVEQSRQDDAFIVTLVTTSDPLALCAQVLTPFEEQFILETGLLPAGNYRVVVNGIETQFEMVAQATASFDQRLLEALNARDVEQLRGMMDDNLLMAYWQSEGGFVAREAAIQQLQAGLLSGSAPILLDETTDLASLLGTDPLGIIGPEGIQMRALLVSGLGNAGADEAILFIASRPNGEPYWFGMLLARDGF